MKVIANKVDYVSEAIGLLTHLADETSYMELKYSLELKRNISFRSKKKAFEVLAAIEKAARKKFFREMEDILFYF